MSNLLEQAIIDAAALRETALKSAESALIDKYKDEFEITVKKLLEQEDPAMTGGDQSAGTVPPEGNMASPDASAGVSGDMSSEEPGGEAFENIPSSFLDGDEDEMITIDFDKIEKQLQDVLSSPMLASPGSEEATGEEETEETPETPEMEAGAMNEELELEESEELEEELDEELELEEEKSCEQDELEEVYDAHNMDTTRDALYPTKPLHEEDSEPAIHIQIVDDEDVEQDEYEGEGEEEFELDEQDAVSPSESPELQKLRTDKARAQGELGQKVASYDKQIAARMAQDQANKSNQITEEEIQELDEEMHVDIDVEGLLSGYMGSTTRKKIQRDNLAKAKARDSREIERMNKEREQLKDLENKLHESQSTNKKYSELVEDLKENLNSLKEHVEKLSISNAKLLYINKVFGDSSLNERQKQNIVESISRATTVLEAKTIYGTLQSTVQSVQESRHKQSLSEALDRGSQAFITRPRVQSSVDDSLSERMKILAGISNKQ